MASTLKRLLIGTPISTEHADHQRISKTIGLAVFSSDAISSTAYATGEILIVLVAAGGMASIDLLQPIAILVVILLALVVNSYRETIHAYPDGGGAYVVSRENLGELPSLVAGASLLTDYILTVAVSVAAGVLAIYSVFPGLQQHRVLLCLAFVAILTLGNLRGVKESGRVFAVPTYVYIVALFGFIGWALIKKIGGDLPVLPVNEEGLAQVIEDHGPYVGSISALIFARAFASGAVALSGVEAISNGIPAFRKPTSRNAAQTLGMMAVILGTAFFALSYIASWMRPTPSETESALSTMGRAVFGSSSPFYYLLQFSTMAILVLAANTAFADFPRLAAIIGRDGYLPRQFATRGDRLVFSNGILILGGAAGILLIAFGGNVTALIPLYAVGVFTSFTLSQLGMVRHHLRDRQPRWKVSVVNSSLGALATFVVATEVVISKFMIGAWIIVVLIPLIVVMFRGVKRHYDTVGRQLRVDPAPEAPPLRHGAVVLVGSVNRSALMALRYARSLCAESVVAISVAIDEDHTERLLQQWRDFGISVPLQILDSPYRDLTNIVLEYLDQLEQEWGYDYIAVVIPEAVVPHWWQGIFHNQSALALKLRLLGRRDTIVINVPFHLAEDPDAEEHLARRRSGATAPEAQQSAPAERPGTADQHT